MTRRMNNRESGQIRERMPGSGREMKPAGRNGQGMSKKAAGIRLIALDMDGTCMNSSSQVTPYTRRVIQALSDRGYLVVPATGRGFYGLREDILGVTGIRYVISANGAVVTDGQEKTRIWERLIPKDTAAQFVKDLLGEANCIYLHRNDEKSTHVFGCVDKKLYTNTFRKADWPTEEDILGAELYDFIKNDGRDVIKLGLWFDRCKSFSDYEPYIQAHYASLNCFRVSECSLELTNGQASKGNALRFLCEYLGIDRSQVCAIGDQGNDISMLQYAGIGAAMGNASDEVKKAADHVAGLNDEDGAAVFLERTFLQ